MALYDMTRTMRVSKTLSRDFEEKAVDIDVVLPDYCAAVSAILKCTMCPTVTACFQSGDRYSVDGVTRLRILYMDEDRTTVHCHEVTQPFSVSFQSVGAIHHTVEIKNDYIHCRATGPRRFDLHGAFRVYLQTVGVGEVEVFTDPHKQEVFCQTAAIACTVPTGEAEKSFVLDEVIDLGVNPDRLLYGDLTVLSCDYKALNHKMIVKGVVGIKGVYIKDQETYSVIHEVPFSQIVDVEGLNEAWVCRVHVSIGESECYLQSNDRGTGTLCIRAKMTACVKCSCKEETVVVQDAYAVDCPLVCETMPLQVEMQGEMHMSQAAVQQTVEAPEGVVKLMDVWGEIKSYERKSDDTVGCCILIGMIGCDTAGQPGYYERTLDCDVSCDSTCEDVTVRLTRLQGDLADGVLKMKASMEVSCCDVKQNDMHVVAKAMYDTAHPYEKNGAAIRIVYADPGQTLWDIGKLHHAGVTDIMAENEYSAMEITAPMMLMIPMA